MNGKILKLANNDLYGNTSDRTVSVFAAFTHLKYMNHYVIFTYTDELDKKVLYYGSVHVKTNSLVVFEVNDNVLPFINNFTEQYLAGKLDPKEYEIIDISKIDKIELVSTSSCEFDRIKELDNIAIKKEKTNDSDDGKSKHGGLYFFLFVIMILLGGVTFLYFNPGILEVPLKELTCQNSLYNDKLEMRYIKELDIKFNKSDEPLKLAAIETYRFSSDEDYLSFKDNNRQNEYFNTTGEYKYNDELKQLKIFYNEETIINNYDELLSYLKHEGYTCQEGIYYE